MWHAAQLQFSASHPAMAGHFPGNPIVPGALLLDEVLAIIIGPNTATNTATSVTGLRPALATAPTADMTIRAAKFLHPIGPDNTIHLRWQTRAGGDIAFECRLDGQESPAMTGTLAHPVQP